MDSYICDEHDYDHHRSPKNCVKKTLSSILEAQRKAMNLDDCDFSCHESVKCLLDGKKKPRKNTIPFMLYCRCKPFKGIGAKTFITPSKQKKIVCISSFVFRINDLFDNCAVLELLIFKNKRTDCCERKCRNYEAHSPCCQLNNQCVDSLMRTGICLTVDLDEFNAITCLPAVQLPPK